MRQTRYDRSNERLDKHIYQFELKLEDLGASADEQRLSETQLPRGTRHNKLKDICDCYGKAPVVLDKDTASCWSICQHHRSCLSNRCVPSIVAAETTKSIRTGTEPSH